MENFRIEELKDILDSINSEKVESEDQNKENKEDVQEGEQANMLAETGEEPDQRETSTTIQPIGTENTDKNLGSHIATTAQSMGNNGNLDSDDSNNDEVASIVDQTQIGVLYVRIGAKTTEVNVFKFHKLSPDTLASLCEYLRSGNRVLECEVVDYLSLHPFILFCHNLGLKIRFFVTKNTPEKILQLCRSIGAVQYE